MVESRSNTPAYTKHFWPIWFVLVFFSSAASSASEQKSSTMEALYWLEDKRDAMSRNVTDLGRYIDNWLAEEEMQEQANETWLRFKMIQDIGSFDGYNSKLKVGGKIDLPRASERWKLIFDTDVNEFNSLQDNRLHNATSGIAIGGFSYQSKLSNGWRVNHDIGLRANLPLDPFYRVKASFGRNFNPRWSGGMQQKVWYYKTEGWGQSTRVYFNRALSEDKFVRIETEIKYRNDRDELEFGQYISLNRNLGDMESVSYELGVLGMSKPNIRIDDYYVQVMYRKAIYEDWLIMEFSPQIVVSRDENWRPQSRFLLNFEVLFFDF